MKAVVDPSRTDRRGLGGSETPRDHQIVVQNPLHYGGVGVDKLKIWLRGLLADLAPDGGSFTIRLTSDQEMQRLNRAFRDLDAPTDVLSFPGEETPEGRHLGDVVISVPTARRQAATQGHPLAQEIQVLVLHGLLHCLGYDHETDDGTMERLESRLRKTWIVHE